ncbi:CCA tRNA nucleotidyltransferase 1, mitochondrial-like [Ptychodera flava]|uniref:CCA tRNA nucleotidyltransferase 1, mitochondrial-like n=1 Tax=Ptychodera flava TaxID=63121 RepID=UPI00396A793D
MLFRTLHVSIRRGFILQSVRRYSNWKMAEADALHCAKKIKLDVDSQEFNSMFTPELRRLADVFKQHNHELRIAGGAVRDLLMGKQPQDVDFATTATPAEMKDMFESEGIRMLNTKGEKHGTITPRINNMNFEVTTLRVDVLTDGRHAEVEFTRDWRIDAERRDLTINSMFLGLDGTVYDFFNGKEDLERRKVEFVGNAVTRIQEDYLRILRYFRFYGRIAESSDEHSQQTLTAIRENADGLAGISGERIWMELKKIVVGNHAANLMRCMYELGLHTFMGLPEDGDLNEFQTVCNRSLLLSPNPMTVVSSLFKNEKGVLALDKRLKISAEERKIGLFIVDNRKDVTHKEPLKPYKDMIIMGSVRDPDTRSKVVELLKYKGEAEMLTEIKNWQMPKFPVSGKDLINMGIKPGKKFGRYIDRLRESWKESNYTSTKEELLQEAEKFKSE